MRQLLCFVLLLLLHPGIFLSSALAASQAGQDNTAVICIAPFEDNTGDKKWEGLATGFSDLLMASFSEYKDVRVVERQRLGDLLKEQEISLRALSDPKTAARVGRLVGAGRIIAGSVLVIKGKLIITAQVLDVASTSVVTSKKVVGNAENVLSLSLKLASELAESLNIKIDPVSSENYDSNPMASLHFMRGLGYYHAGNFDRAIMEFMVRGDLDPNHPTTHYWIGLSYYRLGEFEHAGIELRQFLKDSPKSPQAPEAQKLLKECATKINLDQPDFSPAVSISKYIRKAPESLSGQHLWALAVTAILTERNNRRHDLLGGSERTEENTKEWKQVLSKWWGINNRDDLLKSLDWIEKGGHRKSFEELGLLISLLPDKQYKRFLAKISDNEEAKNKVNIVIKYYAKMGNKSLLAWDYARYISLCRWGYLIGYFTEEEAWDKIMPVARMLQKRFKSWDELGKNYLIGREFWSYKYTKEGGQRYLKIYQKLLDNPESPWNTLPWNMNLGRPVKHHYKNG